MKPEQFIREYRVEKARELVNDPLHPQMTHVSDDGRHWVNEAFNYIPEIQAQIKGMIRLDELKRLVESVDRYSKFANKQEALDAINNAPEGATDYRKLSCGTRYIKQGPRFYEYWNGSEWLRPTVPLTDETHILRFDKLSDLKQAIADYESIYGEGNG
ncbi:hypothetical protein WBV14_04150 [Acinetobacter baumannii]